MRAAGIIAIVLALILPSVSRAANAAMAGALNATASASRGQTGATNNARSLDKHSKQASGRGNAARAQALAKMSQMQALQAHHSGAAAAQNAKVHNALRATDSGIGKAQSLSNPNSQNTGDGPRSSNDESTAALALAAAGGAAQAASRSSNSSNDPAPLDVPTNPSSTSLKLAAVKSATPAEADVTTAKAPPAEASLLVAKTQGGPVPGNDQIVNLATAMTVTVTTKVNAPASPEVTAAAPAAASGASPASKTMDAPISDAPVVAPAKAPQQASFASVAGPVVVGVSGGGISLPSVAGGSEEPLLLSKNDPRSLRNGSRTEKKSAAKSGESNGDEGEKEPGDEAVDSASMEGQLVVMRSRPHSSPRSSAVDIDDSPANIFEYVAHTVRRMRDRGNFAPHQKSTRRLTVR